MDKLLFNLSNLTSIVKDIYTQIDLINHDIFILTHLRNKYSLDSRRYFIFNSGIETLKKYKQFFLDMINFYNHS